MVFLRKIPLAIILVVLFLPTLIAHADPVIGPCQVFPPDNPWNMDVSDLPVDPMSATYIANINSHGGKTVHADFDSSEPNDGIPYRIVTNAQALVPINFDPEGYPEESDLGDYPIPLDAPVEGGDDSDGDRHVIVINTDTCKLYELYNAHYDDNDPINSWTVFESVIWDLNSSVVQQRQIGWTSADAAGLPIFPGLARCAEVEAAVNDPDSPIKHAFRFTVASTQKSYIYPASHEAGDSTSASYPPMGLRVRLKGSYDLSDFSGQSLAIATALKHYGMMLADNGSNWYISGEANLNNPGCWDDDNLHDQLGTIPGTAFEVVSIISPPAQAATKNYFYTDTPTLTWTPITWAASYQLQISRDNTFAGEPILPAPGTSFTTGTLENGIYFWHVRGLGGTTWSPLESFTIRAP